VYLSVPSFEATKLVKQGTSTKLGGVSTGYFSEMNLGLYVGDADESISKNYDIFCNSLKIEPSTLVMIKQTHHTHILKATKEHCSLSLSVPDDRLDYDGVITNEPNVTLVTSYADCVPLMFLDPHKKVIGMAHAGWRGTVEKIGLKLVKTMVSEYGCEPKDILVAIGPSIGSCHFQVGLDVKEAFDNAYNHDIIDKILILKTIYKDNIAETRFYIDLWAANHSSLIEAGIVEGNITTTDLCTMCHQDYFFSHRGTNGKRGSMVAMMSLIAE